MIRYELVGRDLADVRFAVSPLNELVLSLKALRDPGRYPLHLPWLHQLHGVRDRLDLDTLLALTNERLWTPDFLTPAPCSPLTRFEEEMALLARTPGAVVADGLAAVHGAGALPASLRGSPESVLTRILEALDGYWQLCFSGYWPRMRAVLEGDVTYRGREIARRGLAGMFSGLSKWVWFADDVVTVRLHADLSYTRATTGGLTLMPTTWATVVATPISADEPPLIMYAARGAGTLSETPPQPAPGALAGLLGATRAGLLMQLAVPASSTELGVRLGVTTPAVNQHLRALHAAGLLARTRHGRSVLYGRSELGDRLADPSDAG
jgi:DNA-binding transcriptional ArsR family regulator